jgi:hypothetical protein
MRLDSASTLWVKSLLAERHRSVSVFPARTLFPWFVMVWA